jgi:hypothetical protein
LTKGWLERRDCRLPNEEGLFAELVSPRYSFTSNGKLKLESKEELKRRGLPSPDSADAIALTMASDAAVALYGTHYAGSWNREVRRNLKGLV